MSEQPNAFAPSTNEVLQYESEPPTVVDVKVCGPVEVRQLPAKTATDTQYDLDATTPVKILERNPRRARALISAQGSFWMGTTSAQAANAGRRWLAPAGATVPPIEILHQDEEWGIADSAVTVYVKQELWSD